MEWERAERRSLEFMRALEAHDLETVSRMLDPSVVFVHVMSHTGAQEPAGVFRGKDEVMRYLRGASATFSQIRYLDQRVSVTNGGDESFVRARGDLVLAEGAQPYRNVYVFRFEWQGDQIVAVDEYANPITAREALKLPH